ncbi:MAG: ribbon-helix-helix domain-containing protein [Candidatus Omnitrophica bacterium]|nr:ribbon-helix-helix domain-containing protein [Candidatus Omnitrophota bacterium]
MARKGRKSESEALRQVLDAYLKDIKSRGLSFEPYRKISPLGMQVLPRTITIEQDRKLREIAERTGLKISKLAREAVEGHVS